MDVLDAPVSPTSSRNLDDLRNSILISPFVVQSPGSAKIPALVYALYQSMFAAATCVILIGGAAERSRLRPLLVFVFIWSTIVYSPIACATWAPNGWAFQLGALDFAGGGSSNSSLSGSLCPRIDFFGRAGPVHIKSGMGSLALSIYLGKRRGYGTRSLSYRPHSVSHVVLGTVSRPL